LAIKFGLELDPMCEWHLKYYVCIQRTAAVFHRSACIYLHESSRCRKFLVWSLKLP
jgi:hypothetical protein